MYLITAIVGKSCEAHKVVEDCWKKYCWVINIQNIKTREIWYSG